MEAEIAALAGQGFRLEGDDELWKILEEDCFEWSDQYNDYLVYYYGSAVDEDSEIHPSVWKWLVSAMGKVEEAIDLEGGSSTQPT